MEPPRANLAAAAGAAAAVDHREVIPEAPHRRIVPLNYPLPPMKDEEALILEHGSKISKKTREDIVEHLFKDLRKYACGDNPTPENVRNVCNALILTYECLSDKHLPLFATLQNPEETVCDTSHV